VAAWRFLTWLVVLFALLMGTRPAYSLAALAVMLFYILPHVQKRVVQSLVIEYPEEPARLFAGEEAVLSLKARNPSWLPLAWLSGASSVPHGLGGRDCRWVIPLSPKEQAKLECRVVGVDRGIYEVGPVRILGGDLFGISTSAKHADIYHKVIVYPELLPLSALNLPSRLFPGNIRIQQQIYPDPSRLGGVRPYRPGDPLKTVHWKATGRTGTLQVKQYEHTVALNVMILLDMDLPDYDVHSWYSCKELAVQTAAAVAYHAASGGEACGFATFARLQRVRAGEAGAPDQASHTTGALVIPPRHGQPMEILEALAGVECHNGSRFLSLVDDVGRSLTWGSVLILIVPRDTPQLVEKAFSLARLGINVLIIVVGATVEHRSLLRKESQGLRVLRAARTDDRLDVSPQAVRGG